MQIKVSQAESHNIRYPQYPILSSPAKPTNRKMRKGDSEYDVRRLDQAKIPVLFLNALVLVVALVNWALCIWIRVDLDFRRWVQEIEWYTYWYCMYVVIIGMTLVVVASIVQAYGAVQESRGILTVSYILLFVSWIFNLVGGTLIIVYGVEESQYLTDDLKDVFLRLIYEMDYSDRAAAVLRQIQEYVECCGASGSEDYIGARKPVPVECRDMATGSEYRYGCAQQLAWWLEPWSSALAGICIVFLVLHIVQCWFARRLQKRIKVYERAADYDYD